MCPCLELDEWMQRWGGGGRVALPGEPRHAGHAAQVQEPTFLGTKLLCKPVCPSLTRKT